MWCTWLLPLLLLLGAAVIGGFIGWLMRGNKIQTIREEYEAKIKSSEKIIEQEQTASSALQLEYDKLEQKNLAKRTKIATLESDLGDKEKESIGNKSGWDAAVLSLGVLQTKHTTKEKEYSTLAATVAGLEQGIVEKQQQIVAVESDFENWKKESIEKTTVLKQQNSGLNDKIEALEKDIANEKNQFAEAKIKYETEANNLGDVIEDQKLELNTWIKKYNQLSKDKDVALKNYQLLEETTKVEVTSLKEGIKKEQATNTSLEQVRVKHIDQIKELEAQLASAKENSSANKIGWEAAVLSLGLLQTKHDTKEKDYTTLSTKAIDLEKELAEKQEKIVAIESDFSDWKKESVAKATALKQENNSLVAKVEGLEEDVSKHKIELNGLEGIKAKQLLEISAWHKKYNQLSRDKEVVAKNYQLLEERMKVDIEGLEAIIEKEKLATVGLQSSNNQLQEKTSQQTEKITDLESRLKNLELETAQKITTITNNLTNKNAAYQKEIEELEEIIEDQMHQKETDRRLLEELQVNLTKVKKEKDLGEQEIIRLQGLLAKLEKEQKELDAAPAIPLTKEEATLQRIKEKAQQIDFGRIGVASYADRDDLKQIKGIGVFIEKKLYALGIYTFWQIANLSLEDEEKVNQAIEFFPGRVRRDEWVRQGGELHKEKEDEKEENK